ncbi:MAG: TetR family transcriptional regulator [Acidobacteriota bacterium]
MTEPRPNEPADAPGPTPATKDRILDAAESLFAEQGFAAASLRAIIARAEVNLAAIHYHFRNKESLIQAVLERRFAPVNAERLRLLSDCESRWGGGKPEVEPLLEAFLGPMLRAGMRSTSSRPQILQLAGRLLTEVGGLAETAAIRQFREVAQRFVGAFRRALPHLSIEEVAWRVNFTIGAAAKAVIGGVPLKLLLSQAPEGQMPQAPDVDWVLHELVSFAAAGLRAEPVRLRRKGGRAVPDRGRSGAVRMRQRSQK